MENQEQVTTQPDMAGQGPNQGPPPELTINDLQNIRTILDVASRRGAFGGAELSGVGATFDRLNTFLNQVAPPAEAPAAGQPQPSA